MKKWLYGCIFFGILTSIILISIVLNSLEPKKTAKEVAVRTALEDLHFRSTSDYFLFHGNNTYSVVLGINKQGKKAIAWIPEKNGEIIVKNAEDGLSKQAAINKVKKEKNPNKIISATLGMENGIPVWEVYSLNKENRMNYYYLHFETGEWYRVIENL